MGENTGIVWDSNESKAFASAPGAVVWVAPDSSRYEIKVQAIVPNKCLSNNPLPRVVTQEDLMIHPSPKTGFGQFILSTDEYLRADRQGPSFIVSTSTTQAELRKMVNRSAARPLCNSQGTECLAGDFSSLHWKKENIDSAGPPLHGN